MTDPNDMEDPQAGEILPPLLLDDWYAFCMECKGLGQLQSQAIDGAIKLGYELAWQQLKQLMQAALPYFEAGVRDTRLKQADANLVRVLAEYKEIANYQRDVNA